MREIVIRMQYGPMKQQSVAGHTARQTEIPCVTTQFGYKRTFSQILCPKQFFFSFVRGHLIVFKVH